MYATNINWMPNMDWHCFFFFSALFLTLGTPQWRRQNSLFSEFILWIFLKFSHIYIYIIYLNKYKLNINNININIIYLKNIYFIFILFIYIFLKFILWINFLRLQPEKPEFNFVLDLNWLNFFEKNMLVSNSWYKNFFNI